MERRTNRYRLSEEEAKIIATMRGHNIEDYERPEGRLSYRMRLKADEIAKLIDYRASIPGRLTAPVRRLFFDIETSPMITYTWRIGSKVSLSTDQILEDVKVISICYKWEGEDEVHSLVWDKGRDDKRMLVEFVKIANTADILVAHNGDKFDLPLLRARCIYHRIPMFPKYRTLDTLKKARGNFRFSSNKLDYIAQYLGVGAKLKHEGFSMWDKCMQGDEEALERMVAYNKVDVVVLEDVYQTMKHYIKPETHAGVLQEKPKYTCPICANEEISLVKTDVTEKGTVSRVVQCEECGHVYNISNKAYMDYLKNRMDSRV